MTSKLKLAGWSGIGILIIPLIYGIISIFNTLFSIIPQNIIETIYYIILGGLITSFYYGFVILGKRYKSKFLTFTSWTFLIVDILAILTLIIMIFTIPVNIETLPQAQQTDTSLTILLISIAFILAFSILSILFGIALIKNKKIALSKPTGILSIITGATAIILIGFLVAIATTILATILLFKESKKQELQARNTDKFS